MYGPEARTHRLIHRLAGAARPVRAAFNCFLRWLTGEEAWWICGGVYLWQRRGRSRRLRVNSRSSAKPGWHQHFILMAGFPSSLLHRRRAFISELKERSQEIPGAKWAVPQTPPFPTNLCLSRHSSCWRWRRCEMSRCFRRKGPASMWNPL